MAPLPAMIALAALASVGPGGDDPPSWTEDVRPILSEHCFSCHGPDPNSRAMELRLDTLEGLHGKGEGPAPIDLKSPGDSELLYRVSTDEKFDRMPPPGAGPGLTSDEVETLRKWIEGGAKWEAHWAYAPLKPLSAPVAPSGAPSSRARTEIDAFVERRLAAEGLTFAPDAHPVDMIRRVYLDLIGLPPSLEVAEAFAQDPSEAAYAAAVDRLLGSTAFAEHWARHWLDIARYADSHGYTIDGGRSVWPWRDWVVRSIDQDQPFDQFTVEQLAGDLIPGATRDQRLATGFHRNTQINQEGGAKDEENRINAVIDRVNTTGSVWLGTTVGCAQCHTHKFDPVTHTEYFGLYAYFNSTRDGGVSGAPSMLVPRNANEEEKAQQWESAMAKARADYLAAWNRSSETWETWQPSIATGSNGPELRPEEDGSFRVLGQSPVYSTYVLEGTLPVEGAAALRIEALPEGGPGRARNRNFVLQDIRVWKRKVGQGEGDWEKVPLASAHANHEQMSAEGGTSYPAASVLNKKLGGGWAINPRTGEPHAIELEFAEPLPVLPADTELEMRVELVQEYGGNHTLGAFRAQVTAAPESSRQRAQVTEDWRTAWGTWKETRSARPGMPSSLVLEEREEARRTRRFERGSFLDQREDVAPGVPAAMNRFSDKTPKDRLEFARWLVDPSNALVHRVTINRWWQQIFGADLVATENDFGLRGGRPSHPELLEWMTQAYVDSGFSRKAALRRMVMSTAYRQAAAVDPLRSERDPTGSLLSRAMRRRLPGEALRDSMLAVSGVLDRTVGGPPVQPPQPDGVFAFTQSKKSWIPTEGPGRFRRSLYTRIWRSSPYPFYGTFDAPSAGVACTRRLTSKTPLQALALINDPMVMELCEALADRLEKERPGSTPAGKIRAAWRWTLLREPYTEELELLLAHFERTKAEQDERTAWVSLARVLFNLGEFTHRP